MNKSIRLLLMPIAMIILGACGGGGGGGAASTGITYTGKSTPAAITTSNGQTLAAESLTGGKIGATIAAALQSETPSHSNGSRLLSLYKALDTTVERLDPAIGSRGNVLSAAQVTVKDTIPGTCATSPGNYTYTITMDDVTGDYNGSITYTGYCDLGETMNGTTSFSGKYNLTRNDFDSLNISFTELKDTTNTDSDTLSGTVAIDNTKTPVEVTMNLLDRDDHTGEVFKAENFIITDAVATDQSYEDVTLQGRFYDPTEGYVDLSSPQPLRVLAADDWPSSGKLMVTGQNNASATLTALNNTSYQVDIDTNGDGMTDSTATGNWADL